MSYQSLPNIKEYRKNLLALTSKKHVKPVMRKTGCSACGKSLPEAKQYARNQVLQSKSKSSHKQIMPLSRMATQNSMFTFKNRNINKQNYSNKKNLPFENKLQNNFSFFS